ncbi:LysR substrate-binding domain-containing protein [Hwanghaeella sp.]|uniref:LysR substrate-binding domain-containing protein n=1 Tax=Hwanghaeella sp. TaxID=2605943 RepID=UPI003CCBC0E8
MQRKLPSLPALQAFEAAARHENFATAAKELNLSQSAVSHRVRGLESHLGCPLFERLPRGLRLTESAKAYLPTVRSAFEEISSATAGVFGQTGRTVLNIRAPISYTVLWLSSLVDRFQADFPHVEIHLSSSIWVERNATGEADVEFRIGQGSWEGFDAELLFRDPLVPVCSPSTGTAITMPASPETLAGCSLVHVMGTEDYWGRFFAAKGIERPRRKSDIRVDSSIAAAELTVATKRVALIHERFAKPYIEHGRLMIASPSRVHPQEGVYLLRPRGPEQRKPEALLFERWIKDLETAMPAPVS